MSMQDPVSDMLSCVRNAQAIGIKEIELPASNMKLSILRVMKEEGYIDDFEQISESHKRRIKVVLKYYQGKPVIEKMKRISTPGCRVYKSCDKLPLIRGGLGIAIVSTPQGLMTDRAARAARLGGEILCTVE